MSAPYEQQFTQGIDNLKHFDSSFTINESSLQILENTFRRTSDKALEEPFFSIRQRVCTEAAHYANDTTIEPFAYQCLADSHTFLEACVNQGVVQKSYMTLTVGDVSFDGKQLFNTTQSVLSDSINRGISTKDSQRFHVWLTLADMTVIDLTIVSMLINQQRIDQPKNGTELLKVWRPERRGRFDYHPLLIDDAFLSRLQRRAH